MKFIHRGLLCSCGGGWGVRKKNSADNESNSDALVGFNFKTRENISFLQSTQQISQEDARQILSRLPSEIEPPTKRVTSPPLNNFANPLAARPPPPIPAPSVTRAKALWNYNENNAVATDLSFYAGDIIEIVDEKNADWWTGRLNGREGLFPATYVEKLPRDVPQLPVRNNTTHPVDVKPPNAPNFPHAGGPPHNVGGYGPPAPYQPQYPQQNSYYAPPPPQNASYQPYQNGPVAPPPAGPPPNVAPPAAESQENGGKKHGFLGGKLGNTLAHSAVGGVGFGAGTLRMSLHISLQRVILIPEFVYIRQVLITSDLEQRISELIPRSKNRLDTTVLKLNFVHLAGTVCSSDTKLKIAAVLVLLYEDKGQLRVLLTTRSKQLRTHAGQTALPGGKWDPTDSDLIATAFREANEEVALPRDCPHIFTLGLLEPAISLHKILVTPVVAFLSEPRILSSLKAAEGEVAHIFSHPLEAILDPELSKAEPLVPIGSDDWPYQTETYNTSDNVVEMLGNSTYRMHRFRTSASPIKGLTSDILVRSP
ncbi:hypothetical protein D9613_007856 [Agrocybe pediades]|uniref:SH3 domain-containing protein n=1 Tax=Agrocybe pediades TaxID=84607 RepID=A0A8H4QMR9_9AGAR|nr:hypothetical protein D9613_007856 [Agrocybe pediades]